MAEAIEGHCLCGAVAVTLHDPKPHLEICHCDMCRRWGGAYYAAATGASFDIVGHEAITTYASSNWGERAFCATCGSHVWWRFKPTGNRSFHAGLFDAASNFLVEKEIFVDKRAAWSDLSGSHPRQTGAEVIAEAKAAGFSFDEGDSAD